MNTTQQHTVIIVGAGWAGLAAGVDLAQRGIRVTILEAAKQVGGRARRVPFDGRPVDNGQHLLIGAYKESLALINLVMGKDKPALTRIPLYLELLHPTNTGLRIKASKLPAPFNLLLALIRMRGVSLLDRLRAIYFSMKLYMHRFQFNDDISVSTLLEKQHQSRQLVEKLWKPLCLATLNTPINVASADIFIRVLYDAFCQQREDSDLLFPEVDMGKLFPDAAVEYIEQHDGSVRLGQRATSLQIQNGNVIGVVTEKDQFDADTIILATPAHITVRLSTAQPALSNLSQLLNRFSYEPICTVYLQYSSDCRLTAPMLGMLGGIGQWIIDRRYCGQAGLMAVVISASGVHMQWDNARLIEVIKTEVARLFPLWPAPDSSMVIREKRGTFQCQVALNLNRPDNSTPVRGLYLAGDYTRTGYPATLEGAVRSGLRAAKLLQSDQGYI